jgi:hypothetical protein
MGTKKIIEGEVIGVTPIYKIKQPTYRNRIAYI